MKMKYFSLLNASKKRIGVAFLGIVLIGTTTGFITTTKTHTKFGGDKNINAELSVFTPQQIPKVQSESSIDENMNAELLSFTHQQIPKVHSESLIDENTNAELRSFIQPEIIYIGSFDSDDNVIGALKQYFQNRDIIVDQAREQILEQNPHIVHVGKYGGLQKASELECKDVYVVVGEVEPDDSTFIAKVESKEVDVNYYPNLYTNDVKLNVYIVRYK